MGGKQVRERGEARPGSWRAPADPGLLWEIRECIPAHGGDSQLRGTRDSLPKTIGDATPETAGPGSSEKTWNLRADGRVSGRKLWRTLGKTRGPPSWYWGTLGRTCIP